MATAAKPRCRSEARLTWLALAFLTLGSAGVVVIGVLPPVLLLRQRRSSWKTH